MGFVRSFVFLVLRFCSPPPPPLSHDDTPPASSRLVGVLGVLNLADQQLKGLGHVLTIPGTSFSEGAIVLFGERLAFLVGYLSLLWSEVGLVANNADWDGVGALFFLVNRL